MCFGYNSIQFVSWWISKFVTVARASEIIQTLDESIVSLFEVSQLKKSRELTHIVIVNSNRHQIYLTYTIKFYYTFYFIYLFIHLSASYGSTFDSQIDESWFIWFLIAFSWYKHFFSLNFFTHSILLFFIRIFQGQIRIGHWKSSTNKCYYMQ